MYSCKYTVVNVGTHWKVTIKKNHIQKALNAMHLGTQLKYLEDEAKITQQWAIQKYNHVQPVHGFVYRSPDLHPAPPSPLL